MKTGYSDERAERHNAWVKKIREKLESLGIECKETGKRAEGDLWVKDRLRGEHFLDVKGPTNRDSAKWSISLRSLWDAEISKHPTYFVLISRMRGVRVATLSAIKDARERESQMPSGNGSNCEYVLIGLPFARTFDDFYPEMKYCAGERHKGWIKLSSFASRRSTQCRECAFHYEHFKRKIFRGEPRAVARERRSK